MSAQERARLNSIYTRAEGGIARALPIRAAAQGGRACGRSAAYAVPPFPLSSPCHAYRRAVSAPDPQAIEWLGRFRPAQPSGGAAQPFSPTGPMKVLVIEDEKKLAEYLRLALTEHNYVVDVAMDGSAACIWLAKASTTSSCLM